MTFKCHTNVRINTIILQQLLMNNINALHGATWHWPCACILYAWGLIFYILTDEENLQ